MKYSLLISAIAMSGAAFAQTEAVYMPTSDLIIETSEAEFQITAEVADDPNEIATGVMFRDGIEPDHGMIFEFAPPREANMYMRNVSFPIDMVFIDTDGTVLATVSHVQAQSERRINPGFNVAGVLELPDGAVIEYGLKPGDMIRHDLFGNMPETTEPVEPAEEPASEN
tara:strand:- start:522 stop:1028 length:507 start_codon:yes stop_codon:yes gene_type:complete